MQASSPGLSKACLYPEVLPSFASPVHLMRGGIVREKKEKLDLVQGFYFVSFPSKLFDVDQKTILSSLCGFDIYTLSPGPALLARL